MILVGVMKTIYMDYTDKTLVDLNLDYRRKKRKRKDSAGSDDTASMNKAIR